MLKRNEYPSVFSFWTVCLLALVVPSVAWGANVLFVSDCQTDTNIPTVLQGDGHTVTVVLNDYSYGNNATLQGNVSMYDCIFWSATGGGYGDVHNAATFTNLLSYVNAGGKVFVTGYDTIASPNDPDLQAFLGGSGSCDSGYLPEAIINVSNSLTTGVVDIRGVTPTGSFDDRDELFNLGSDTIDVCHAGCGGAQWTLRTYGSGEIAYVSNGEYGPASAHATWQDTTPGGAGAYNAAIRNFADNAGSSVANVLFVSDCQTDTNIPTVLQGDGHTVTVVLNDYSYGNNATLQGNVSGYDCIFWSATGGGYGDVHNAATFTNLLSYVNAGGKVFVTGYDTIASPNDPDLQAFLGGSGSCDSGYLPEAIINVSNSLTTGVVDIRGVTPTGSFDDRDELFNLGSDTIDVCHAGCGGAQWTLRTYGSGEIAYVSNGEYGPASAHATWQDTTPGGAGAYNAAIRNFTSHSGSTPATPTPTSTNTPTATPTPTSTNTPTATPTSTPTDTPTATPTMTPTPTSTNTPTATPTPTFTNTPTATPTMTPTPTSTNTPTATPTSTPTDTPTATPTMTPTPTSTDTPTMTPSPTPTPEPCPNDGDVDMSGVISSGDAQLAFYIALGTIIPTEEQECRADCNGDGVISSGDAQSIFYAALGSGSCADPILN